MAYSEQLERKELAAVARAILAGTKDVLHRDQMRWEGWSENSDSSLTGRIIVEKDCEGFSILEVAEAMQQILIKHLCATDDEWKERAKKANEAEDAILNKKPTRKALVDTRPLDGPHTWEMKSLMKDLKKIIMFHPFQNKTDQLFFAPKTLIENYRQSLKQLEI